MHNMHLWTRYAKNSGAVFSLKYHLVWCPQYRRPVLGGPVAKRLKKIIMDVAAELEATIHVHEIMPDHVHLFLESDARWSVAEIANRIKGTRSRLLRAEFPHLRSRIPAL